MNVTRRQLAVSGTGVPPVRALCSARLIRGYQRPHSGRASAPDPLQASHTKRSVCGMSRTPGGARHPLLDHPGVQGSAALGQGFWDPPLRPGRGLEEDRLVPRRGRGFLPAPPRSEARVFAAGPATAFGARAPNRAGRGWAARYEREFPGSERIRTGDSVTFESAAGFRWSCSSRPSRSNLRIDTGR
jgi:hypothetical protein